MTDRQTVQQLAREFYDRGDRIGWFDKVYETAGQNPNAVPWAEMRPNTHLTAWVENTSQNLPRDGSKKALVVACGLGDDAEALAAAGFEVTAFDISQHAIDWALQRFSDSTVQYSVNDLFMPPPAWANAFDFVFESSTLQALPWDLRATAFQQIADFVAPDGKLLVVAFGREPDEDAPQLPWPLTRDELSAFEDAGLLEIEFEDVQVPNQRRQFVVEYQKPTRNDA
ncbi:MAG: class I SAM-dependent methyltransferase [Planctomycetaceae bacterium]